jgi:hypothetical protein
MVYSPKHKELYLHNPKTGGKSLMFSLQNSSHDWKRDYHMHVTLKELSSNDLFQNYNITATVRNPWSRAVSLYFHSIADRRFYREHTFGNNKALLQNSPSLINFETFLKKGYIRNNSPFFKYIQPNFFIETEKLKFTRIFKYENWDEIKDYYSKVIGKKLIIEHNYHTRESINPVIPTDLSIDYRNLYNEWSYNFILKHEKSIIDKFNYTL